MIPTPACTYGYTLAQCQDLMDARTFASLARTTAMRRCIGYEWSVWQQRVQTCDEAHGYVVAAVDVERLLAVAS
ncbi:MAG: hypothetical protein J7518_12445 [Nocardioidaceae bacterium]|nr:hypothetical protein [Nocardioidaceae bacterium]